eukprot:CAMPEP_0114418432 /NCGR_PEP_ID=MMETSP0103-20121206/3494_1 /TAXON_ID=37642 ORGANISM="Paraphysomonas imperforata, Strain PA2" /NCGR_SAMPLE_ID=MMETSP0103 /ASSEMBLY_ACC=CAM_ASM_000201 /LENGTH=175 /DNA_ID=CAMNT_0001586791 /DNA_START=47 /DNA_END=574 /DNA_ORIENTATION=-
MDLSSYLDQIRRQIDKTALKKYADELYKKTGVAPEVVVVAIGALLAVMLFFGIFPHLICDLVAYVFPFYGTLSTIESKKFKKNWLVYWVLVGMIGILETVIHIILYWIPFYYPLKAVFLVWAMHPQYEGATAIYDKFLKDHVKSNIEKVDSAMENVTVENIAKVVADASASSKAD